jgi:DNA-directed RNA polymerase subunit RPC12/RpoP
MDAVGIILKPHSSMSPDSTIDVENPTKLTIHSYERILSRIAHNSNPAEWEIARKLLGWMICARRPLKWHEIQGACSTDVGEQSVNFDERKLRLHIRDVCGSLILVMPGDRVELVHSTAKLSVKNMVLLQGSLAHLPNSYIADIGYVHTSIVECNLTALCLQYFTFECFEQDIGPEKLLDFAAKGYFAFQDYAIANWSHHFHAMVGHGQHLLAIDSDKKDAHEQHLLAIDSDKKDAVQELEVALSDFADNYEEDILQETVVGSSERACEAFRQCNFYHSLRSVWSHIYRHQERGIDARNDVSLKVLGEALARNRRMLEDLASSANCSFTRQRDLDSFYGDKVFKCSKLTCFYFHEGFTDAKNRALHINRHDRPFRCTFPDCSVTEFGFSSSKDLDKHMRSFHPESNDLAVTFAATKPVIASTSWVCHKCDKRFTRGFHLRSHMRSHNGERPYACSECGKAFTRDNDRKRHEKIHARR